MNFIIKWLRSFFVLEHGGIILLIDLCKLAHNPIDLLCLPWQFEPAQEQPEGLVEIQVLEIKHQTERLQHALVEIFGAAEVLPQGLFADTVWKNKDRKL